jgi:hypothetical protein
MKKFLIAALCLFLFQTSFAGIVIVNGLSHEHTLSNGQKVQGDIVIKNTAKENKRAIIYLADVIHNCEGETLFLKAGQHKRTNTEWLQFSTNEVNLKPDETLTLTYDMTPSADVDSKGSYWGVIMVEEAEELDTSDVERGVKVKSLVRYAIQIIGSYEGNAVKELDISAVSMKNGEEGEYLQISINNLGNYMLKPIVILELYDENGEQVSRLEMPYRKIYPGLCKTFEIPLKGVAKGVYNGVLVADCGDENLYGLNLDVTVGATAETAEPENADE